MVEMYFFYFCNKIFPKTYAVAPNIGHINVQRYIHSVPYLGFVALHVFLLFRKILVSSKVYEQNNKINIGY